MDGLTMPVGGTGPSKVGPVVTLVLALTLVVGTAATSAAHAQWVEEPGQGWADLTFYHQDTRETYDSQGEVRDLFADGRAVSTSAFLTVAGGILPGLDGWLQVPYHTLQYDDIVDERTRTGIGDTRLYLRTAPLRHLGFDFPFAIRAGVKVPVSDFQVDAEVIPLGDGQTDWEVMAEVGHSFYPTAAYVSGWVGYRWRETNEETFRDYGNEAFFLAQSGISAGRWSLEVVAEGLRTVTDPSLRGLTVVSAKRELLTVAPMVGYAVGPGGARVGARFTLAGQNLPAGYALVVGYFTRWGF